MTPSRWVAGAAAALTLAVCLSSRLAEATGSQSSRTHAQQPSRAAEEPPQHPSGGAPAGSPAPYEPELLRLSQLIGALAYLRDLCGQGDGDAWRAKMNGLVQAMGDSDLRRQRMAGAYNKGFRDYELMYRTCTPNARAIISRYLAEGEKLSRDVVSRFGNG